VLDEDELVPIILQLHPEFLEQNAMIHGIIGFREIKKGDPGAAFDIPIPVK